MLLWLRGAVIHFAVTVLWINDGLLIFFLYFNTFELSPKKSRHVTSFQMANPKLSTNVYNFCEILMAIPCTCTSYHWEFQVQILLFCLSFDLLQWCAHPNTSLFPLPCLNFCAI